MERRPFTFLSVTSSVNISLLSLCNYDAPCFISRYVEISMYLAMCFVARYMEISMYLAICFVKEKTKLAEVT